MTPSELIIGPWREVGGVCVVGDPGGRSLRPLLYEGRGRASRWFGQTGAGSLEEGLRLWKRESEAAYFRDRERSPSHARALDLARRFVKGRALDVGCGVGHLLRELGPEAVGLDSSFANLYLARRFVAPGALLVRADASAGLPLVDGAFDAVVSVEAFTYVRDRARLAREMLRVWSGRSSVVLSHLHRSSPPPANPVTREELEAWFPGSRVEEDSGETFSVVLGPRP